MVRTVKVILENKKGMKDKKGRNWLGQNPEAEKPNDFRKTKNIAVLKSQPKRLRAQTERHEIAEEKLMKQGKPYKVAHRAALRVEKKPLKGIKIKEVEKRVK